MAEREMKIVCPYCDTEQKDVHPWVYAHWHELLSGKCDHCGKAFLLRSGHTSKMKEGRP